MTSFVVTHHAHHPDEGESGIYRLCFAPTWLEPRVVPNPDYDPNYDHAKHNPEQIEIDNPHFDMDAPFVDLSQPSKIKVANPDWDPNANPREIVANVPVTGVEHEVVWDAGDERWEGMKPDEIAHTQRQIVARTMADREAAARKAAREEQASFNELPGVRQPL